MDGCALSQKFITDPNYSLTLLQQDVMTDFVVHVSLTKCFKAKQIALEVVFGNHKEKYNKIYEYLNELRETNIGTTTIYFLKCRLFKRMYVCLQAMKYGFKASCRRMICLDGCFLKGYYGDQLLVAIGIDVYDCIYPLAYAVVESENYESWYWFLLLLKTDFNMTNSYHWSFMSDKQKVHI